MTVKKMIHKALRQGAREEGGEKMRRILSKEQQAEF